MKLIVGLGNPGSSYRDTRHNLGSRCVRAIAKRYKVKLKLNRSLKSRVTKIEIMGRQCLLALPHTFMNLSGEAVELLLRKENISTEDLLIVHDDMDLELGVLRFRKKGSSAGHKGISSIIKVLNTEEFNRLKLGIGKAKEDIEASDYVLSSFSRKEIRVINKFIQNAVRACEIWIKFGMEKVMNEFN